MDFLWIGKAYDVMLGEQVQLSFDFTNEFIASLEVLNNYFTSWWYNENTKGGGSYDDGLWLW